MKVCVDPKLCSGCGPCVDICPEVFRLNDKGLAEVQVEEVSLELENLCREAAECCPRRSFLAGQTPMQKIS